MSCVQERKSELKEVSVRRSFHGLPLSDYRSHRSVWLTEDAARL